jgi:phosphoenolpyruvate-protein phosphotransferase (PTS system enzyme I)
MEERINGLSASSGFAVGVARLLHRVDHGKRKKLSPDQERVALETAIAGALRDIAALIQSQSGDAVDILGFQQAILEDDALTETVWPAIASGDSADDAWCSSLDGEIAEYEGASDAHFSSRVADLRDIRDRVLAQLFGSKTALGFDAGDILVADDIAPSAFMTTDWSKCGALVLGNGSPYSHVAMLARSRSIPMVVGIGDCWKNLAGRIMVDGEDAVITLNPSADAIGIGSQKMQRLSGIHNVGQVTPPVRAATMDGTAVDVLINVASLIDISDFPASSCDGIGLTRTEFFIEDVLRDEEQQYLRYVRLLSWAGGKPVTIRTLDAGGDKPIRGYTVQDEANPFLGMRGIRLSLSNLDVFKIQLRALLRASAVAPLKIMLPMVTQPSDLEMTRALMSECCRELAAAGQKFGSPKLGIMVEVPAVAMAPGLFNSDFFSIGSNDLTQYATAAARDNSSVANYADILHAGVISMIGCVVQHGHLRGVEVSLCGDAAAEPSMVEVLLKAGIRVLSVPVAMVASTKAAIGKINLKIGDTHHE